jgi:hypothetical protein
VLSTFALELLDSGRPITARETDMSNEARILEGRFIMFSFESSRHADYDRQPSSWIVQNGQ